MNTYDMIRAENSKDNWKTFIKYLSIALMVWGALGAILNIFEILGSMFSSDSDPHSVHYNDDGALFVGATNALIKLLSLAQNGLIIVQGWFGYKATEKNNAHAIQDLMYKSIYLTIMHIAIMFIQVLIAATIISSSANE